MNTLGSRIKSERLAKKLTQEGLGDLVGVGKSAISQWESGQTKKMDGMNMVMTAKALGVDPFWLATGKGTKTKEVIHDEANLSEGPEIRGYVPLISSVPAGDWKEAIDNYHPGHGEKMVAVTVPVQRHTFALRVTGDSMEPEFVEGELIIIEPDMQPEHRDYVVAKNGGDATLKQLWRESGDWYLKPLNDRYPIKPLGESEIIGVVREKTKMYR